MSDISFIEIEHPKLTGDEGKGRVPEASFPVLEKSGWKRVPKSRTTESQEK